jgi:hypothetical protein
VKRREFTLLLGGECRGHSILAIRISGSFTKLENLIFNHRVLTPVPLSNVAPAIVISLISLAYVEEDGLLLSVAFLAAIILIGIASAAVWGTIVGAVLISAL